MFQDFGNEFGYCRGAPITCLVAALLLTGDSVNKVIVANAAHTLAQPSDHCDIQVRW